MSRRATEPTQAELQAAWRYCKGRPTWPASFEEALAHPTYSRLLQLTAKHPPHQVRAGHVSKAPAPGMPVRHAVQPYTPPQFDRKRAAAGDRDDD